MAELFWKIHDSRYQEFSISAKIVISETKNALWYLSVKFPSIDLPIGFDKYFALSDTTTRDYEPSIERSPVLGK